MTARAEFLAALRAGLHGAPGPAVDDAIADYASHFDEGAVAGRNDADIAAALGNPAALADELRAELHIRRWQAAPTARTALQVIASSVALGAFNSLLLLFAAPLILLLALGVTLAIATFAIAGVWFAFDGASLGLPGGVAVVLLCSLGLVAAAISLAAGALLAGKALISALGRYARGHYRLLSRPHGPGHST